MDTEKKTTQIMVRVTPQLKQELTDFKVRTGIPKGHVIREGIALFMDKYAQGFDRPKQATE